MSRFLRSGATLDLSILFFALLRGGLRGVHSSFCSAHLAAKIHGEDFAQGQGITL